MLQISVNGKPQFTKKIAKKSLRNDVNQARKILKLCKKKKVIFSRQTDRKRHKVYRTTNN